MTRGIEIKPITEDISEIQSISIIDEHKITSCFAFLAATTVTIIIGILLNFVPNVLDTEHIINTYNFGIEYFVPETSEKLQYIICTLSFPILYILFHLWFRNYSIKGNALLINGRLKFLEIVFIVEGIIFINYIDPFYVSTITLSEDWWIILGYTVFGMLLFAISMNIFNNIQDKRTVAVFLFMIILVFIFFLAKLYVTSSYFNNNVFVSRHFDAYFYPVYKVYCGQTPLVDFNCLYGFYPYFLAPIFKIFGGISMYRFSLVMAGLIFISLSSIAATIFILCKNKIVAFFGSIAVVFTMSIFPLLYDGTYYHQNFPHRVPFPTLLILLCSFLIVYVAGSKLR